MGSFGNKMVAFSGRKLFLDTFSGAAVGWSLQNLKETTVFVVRVRRSSDNVEQDFRAIEITNGALLTFVGANDGFVTTIYDQVGSNNFTQVTTTRQGFLVNAGVLNLLNGKPVILRNTVGGGYISSYAPNGATAKGLFYLGRMGNAFNQGIMIGTLNNGASYIYNSQINGSNTNVNSNATLSNQKINGSTFTYSTLGDVYSQTQNQSLIAANIIFNFVSNSLSLGYRFTNPSTLGMWSFQELVIFDNTNETAAKENNINSRYSIY
jgi:hypothetical protein